MQKNRTDVKLTLKQLKIISLMGEGWAIKQHGSKTAHLVESSDGVENFRQKDVTSIGIATMKVLLKKKLIEVDERVTWNKLYRLSPKGESVLLSLFN